MAAVWAIRATQSSQDIMRMPFGIPDDGEHSKDGKAERTCGTTQRVMDCPIVHLIYFEVQVPSLAEALVAARDRHISPRLSSVPLLTLGTYIATKMQIM